MIAQITTGVVCGLIVVASARITEAQLLQRRQMNQPKQLLLLKRPQRGEGLKKRKLRKQPVQNALNFLTCSNPLCNEYVNHARIHFGGWDRYAYPR